MLSKSSIYALIHMPIPRLNVDDTLPSLVAQLRTLGTWCRSSRTLSWLWGWRREKFVLVVRKLFTIFSVPPETLKVKKTRGACVVQLWSRKAGEKVS